MIRPRAEVVSTAPGEHGGPETTAENPGQARLDFSSSMNAWGPAPAVLQAIRTARPDTFPDRNSLAPRRAASERWARPMGEIAFGAGSTELLHALSFAYLRPTDTVLVPAPTFGEYGRAASLCGARVLQGIAAGPAFALDLPAISAAVVHHSPRLAFLCVPNNPTGQTFEREELQGLADACHTSDTLLVLDQAYDAFSAQPLGTPALPGHPAVLHLRSLTNDHALAGVRAGFAVGPPSVIAAIRRVRPPWPTSTMAEAAAAAALTDAAEGHVSATASRLRFQRELMQGALGRMRIPTVATSTHFMLAAVGAARQVATRLREEHGIQVRDCTSFGLPDHIRIAARLPEDNEALTRALEATCSS